MDSKTLTRFTARSKRVNFVEKLLAYTLVAIGRIISKRVRGILVSPHIRRKEAERMGFGWAGSIGGGGR